jgi:phosphonatase-like hydrolase
MAKLPELLVSDFAGTLLHDGGAVLAAYRVTLEEFGIPFAEDELHAWRGASKRAVFEHFAARLGVENASAIAGQALTRFEAELSEAYASEPVEEIPGASAVIEELRASDVRVALTTGFPRGLTELLVARLEWSELFDLILTPEDVPVARPAPYMIFQAMQALGVYDVGRVAVVGDTPLDLAAGSNARCGWVIGVLSGAHGVETLGVAPHTHLLPSVTGLPALFGLRTNV